RRRGGQSDECADAADHLPFRRRRGGSAARHPAHPRLPARGGRMSQPADSLATSGLTPRRETRPATAYSRFVTAMKLLLPSVAIGLVMLVAVWPRLQFSLEQMRPSRPRLDLS